MRGGRDALPQRRLERVQQDDPGAACVREGEQQIAVRKRRELRILEEIIELRLDEACVEWSHERATGRVSIAQGMTLCQLRYGLRLALSLDSLCALMIQESGRCCALFWDADVT